VKRAFYISLIFLFVLSTARGQSIYHPWLVEGGVSFTDFGTAHRSFPEKFTSPDWMGLKAPTMVKLGRMIKPCLRAELILASNTIHASRLNQIPLSDTVNSTNYYKIGLQAAYNFANEKILKETFFIDPYLFSGLSFSRINSKFYPGIPLGVGFNVWPLEYFGLNIQTSYEYVFDFDDYLHLSMGVIVRFGNMIDKDRDRVPDRYDACPEIFGLEKQQGCPDYDYDGVVDSLDKCPTEYGWPGAQGCPDYDRDGVPDKFDLCPCQAGIANFDGCPDSLRRSDLPPRQQPKMDTYIEVIVPEEKTAQQVADQAQEQVRTWENTQNAKVEPEPVETAVVVPLDEKPTNSDRQVAPVIPPRQGFGEKTESFLRQVRFNKNSAIIQTQAYPGLNSVALSMKSYPAEHFVIYGMPDNDAKTEYNSYLSMARAKAVRSYLISQGVEASSIQALGFDNLPGDMSFDAARMIVIQMK
jgi:outer membrane protein OmpA-like peptidoglycan-associated protein